MDIHNNSEDKIITFTFNFPTKQTGLTGAEIAQLALSAPEQAPRIYKVRDFYRYGKRLVVVNQRNDQDYDVLAYSSIEKRFVQEPKLYALIQFNTEGLAHQLTQVQFETELAAKNISSSQWQDLLS